MTTSESGISGKSRTVDLGTDLHYVHYPGSGPPLVLVHGLGGSHLNWMLVARALAASFEVYALDLPGFGLTPPGGRSSHVRDQAELVERFIGDVVGSPAFVAGNSMGGLITVLLADRAPHLVSGVVLIDPALVPPSLERPDLKTVRYLGTPLVPGMGPWIMKRRRDATPVDRHVEMTMDFVTADISRIPPQVMRAGEAMEEARRKMPWSIDSFVEAGRSIATVLSRRGAFSRMIHRIAAPVLLIHGDEDIVVPTSAAQWLANERPDWDFLLLEGVGHVPQLETPDLVIDAIVEWSARVE